MQTPPSRLPSRPLPSTSAAGRRRRPWLALLLLPLLSWLADAPAFADPPPEPAAPDRCAELDEHGHPKYCTPTGPDMAPWWDDLACCLGSDCVEVGPDGCDGRDEVYCLYAELDAAGQLTCLYEVPAFCDVFDCEAREPRPEDEPEPVEPTSWVLCCYGMDNCYEPQGGPCGGDMYYCYEAVTNLDGTSACLDGVYVW